MTDAKNFKIYFMTNTTANKSLNTGRHRRIHRGVEIFKNDHLSRYNIQWRDYRIQIRGISILLFFRYNSINVWRYIMERKRKSNMGRKPILVHNKEAVNQFLHCIEIGMTIGHSAEYAQIATTSIYEWITEQDRSYHTDFLNTPQEFIKSVETINAAQQDWKVALKMRYSKDYGDKQELSLSGDDLGIKIINDVK